MKYLIGTYFSHKVPLKKCNIGPHTRLKEEGIRWLKRNLLKKKKGKKGLVESLKQLMRVSPENWK